MSTNSEDNRTPNLVSPHSDQEETRFVQQRKGRKRIVYTVEEEKERKRLNRKNCDRNHYGHEGFSLLLLCLFGCKITFERITNNIKNKKMKIISIEYNNEILFHRINLEMLFDTHPVVVNHQKSARVKNEMIEIQTDNYMLDLLKYRFNINFTDNIKKNPDTLEKPGRRVITSININYKEMNERDIIEDGFNFYETIRNSFPNRVNFPIDMSSFNF